MELLVQVGGKSVGGYVMHNAVVVVVNASCHESFSGSDRHKMSVC